MTSALSTIFEIGALAVGRRYGLKFIPAGPYGFIFAALYQFYKIIPPSSHYTFLGINISNKASVYFLTALPVRDTCSCIWQYLKLIYYTHNDIISFHYTISIVFSFSITFITRCSDVWDFGRSNISK